MTAPCTAPVQGHKPGSDEREKCPVCRPKPTLANLNVAARPTSTAAKPEEFTRLCESAEPWEDLGTDGDDDEHRRSVRTRLGDLAVTIENVYGLHESEGDQDSAVMISGAHAIHVERYGDPGVPLFYEWTPNDDVSEYYETRPEAEMAAASYARDDADMETVVGEVVVDENFRRALTALRCGLSPDNSEAVDYLSQFPFDDLDPNHEAAQAAKAMFPEKEK